MHFEVIIEESFSSAHALRHYYGKTEPLHGHNFKVRLVVRGDKLQNKVKYLTDFVALKNALRAVIEPLNYVNLNEVAPFDQENPSAEALAVHIGDELRRRWSDEGVTIASVTVWETPDCAARVIF